MSYFVSPTILNPHSKPSVSDNHSIKNSEVKLFTFEKNKIDIAKFKGSPSNKQNNLPLKMDLSKGKIVDIKNPSGIKNKYNINNKETSTFYSRFNPLSERTETKIKQRDLSVNKTLLRPNFLTNIKSQKNDNLLNLTRRYESGIQERQKFRSYSIQTQIENPPPFHSSELNNFNNKIENIKNSPYFGCEERSYKKQSLNLSKPSELQNFMIFNEPTIKKSVIENNNRSRPISPLVINKNDLYDKLNKKYNPNYIMENTSNGIYTNSFSKLYNREKKNQENNYLDLFIKKSQVNLNLFNSQKNSNSSMIDSNFYTKSIYLNY